MMTETLQIRQIDDANKFQFISLLLIGDESEKMIGRYVDRGTLYAGYIGETAVAVCLTTDEGAGVVEVKNLAVRHEFRRRGIGRRMLAYIESINSGMTIQLGTGETPSTLRFYESCGYVYSHRIHDFFSDNYPAPIIEEGITLTDMIYLAKKAGHQSAD